MNGHTRFLEVLVLTASAFPTQIAALPALFGASPRRHARGASLRPELYIVPVAVWLTAVLALTLSGQATFFVGADPVGWAGIALAAGGFAVVLELLVGSVWSWAAAGARPAGIEMAEGVHGVGRTLALSTAVTGFGEELLFRGVWLAILLRGLGWPALAATGLVTVVYAANHAYLGLDIVVQKVCAGCIFVVLAYEGGGVLAAGIAHVSENVLIAFLPALLSRARRPAS